MYTTDDDVICCVFFECFLLSPSGFYVHVSMLFCVFLYLLLMLNVLTTCALICPIKCVSLHSVFHLYIYMFLMHVVVSMCFIAIYLCCYDNMRVSLLFFFIFFGIYIHVICNHILLVCLFSFPSVSSTPKMGLHISPSDVSRSHQEIQRTDSDQCGAGFRCFPRSSAPGMNFCYLVFKMKESIAHRIHVCYFWDLFTIP